MDENKTSAPEGGLNSGKWIGQLVAAVILAEGIWGLLASVTNNLLVPLLARVMEADPQSPLYLGKGELDFPAVFRSVLALCLAGIVFVLLREWSRRKPAQVRVRTMQVTRKVSQPTAGPLSITTPPLRAAVAPLAAPRPVAQPPAQPAPTQPTPTPQISPPAVSAPPVPAPVPSKPMPPPVQSKPMPPPVATKKPAKPKPPKEVYYNIVGEPINPTEDD